MLSPVDIQNKEFKKAKIGGYHIDDVNEFLDQILKSYEELINENYTLKDKVNVLSESVQYYKTMESTIQNVLVLADKTAQDTKAAAYQKADQIKKDAEVRSDKMLELAEERVGRIIEQGRQEGFELTQKNDEIRRQYLTYRSQFKQLLQSQLDFVEQHDKMLMDSHNDLEEVFSAIKEETRASVDEKECLASELAEKTSNHEMGSNEKVETVDQDNDEIKTLDEEKFYTKEYLPLCDEELA